MERNENDQDKQKKVYIKSIIEKFKKILQY